MPNEQIHSGHFMTSNPHSDKLDDEDEDVEVDVVDVDDNENEPEVPRLSKTSLQETRSKIFRIKNDENPVTFYKFGPQKQQSIAIDVSLNKLHKCIKIAYMKMTTPKWKDFKGLKLQWKHRIRLNNVIWRAYYMEFRKPDRKKKTPYCYFAVPDEDTTHQKIEGTVLEGMYWKRRMEAVCAQYKRWRNYNRPHKIKKTCCPKTENACECKPNQIVGRPNQSQTPNVIYNTSNDYFDDDEFENEFTNELFNKLGTPFLFPNPREMGFNGNADFMQPGLFALQPSLEEIMTGEQEQADVDMLEPTISTMNNQASHSNGYNNQFQSMSGMSSPLNSEVQPSKQRSQHAYNNKNYNSNYTQSQPTRQSSIPGIMDAHMSQPLYSQAVYENKTLGASNLESPVASVISRDKLSRSSANFTPTTSLTNLDYMPQFTASMNTNSFSVINGQNGGHGLKSFVMDQPGQLISAPAWWMPNQLQAQHQQQVLRNPQDSQNGFPNVLLNLNNQPMQQNQQNFSLIPVSHHFTQMKAESDPMGHLAQHQNTVQTPTNSMHPPSHPSTTRLPPGPTSTDLSHYLPHNESAAPSASLASMLTAKPRDNQQERGFESTRNGTVHPAGKIKSDVRQTKEDFLNEFEDLASTAIGLKKRQRLAVTEPIAAGDPTSTQSSPAPQRLRNQRKGVRTRSSQISSQPASVQSFGADSLLSPQGSTPTTEGFQSDGSDEKIPAKKRRRYNQSCSEAADSTLNPEERKRLLHLNAEKNRREALKDGFDALVSAIPVIDEAGIKVTNAVVLNRAGQHIRNLQNKLNDSVRALDEAEKRNEMLQKRVILVQSSLPSTVSQSSGSKDSDSMQNEIHQFVDRYVKERAKEDSRFFVMATMLKPMIDAFARKIHPGNNKQQMRESIRQWGEESFRVSMIRPLASQTLIKIAAETNLMMDGKRQPLSDYIANQVDQLGQYKDL
ncbi:unnamed protein product [Bursaphelenchus xylophilus]|uniref:(pine wood nematode) hypothetical protein n=1 Tax=Bursaphelenchus xylophilus TaxID=6326 RepID=A0A1I7SUH4_BURXY|nr:unnamed protein product [Bursaphelenchus xylophilus]CAG9107128.1 unnamed protein product [Bursaphelenchus xylophilus]